MRLDLRGLFPVFATSAVVATLAAWYALGIYVPAFNTQTTAISGVDHPPSPLTPTPGLTRRLVFVIVDGMKYDVARELPELAALRRAGTFREITPEPLVYTGPEITAMMTGLAPEDSGVRLNGDHQGVPKIGAVTEELAAAHVAMEVDDENFSPFARLLRVPEGTKVISGRIHFVADLIRRRIGLFPPLPPIDLKTPAREVAFVHIEDVDEEGHRFGGSSPQYLEAAHQAGTLVSRIAATLDFNQDTLIALSDHGHTDAGGHGGIERDVTRAFFLGVGGVFRSGVELEKRPTREIAPTLAVLTGVRAPTSSLSLPMIDAMSVDESVGSVLLAGPFDQAAHLLCKLSPSERCKEVDALVPRLAGHDPAALAEAGALFDALTAERARGREIEVKSARATRTIGATAFALAAAAVLAWFGRRAGRGAVRAGAWAALPALALVYAAAMAAHGFRPSFSAIKAGYGFARGAAPAAVAGAIAATLVVLLLRPGRLGPWVMLAGVCLPYAVLAAYAGADPRFVAPPIAGPLVLELGPAVVGAALAASAIAVVNALRPERREGG